LSRRNDKLKLIEQNFRLNYEESFFIVSLMSHQEFFNQEPHRREAFELQPHLVGDLIEVRPLKPKDWESLFAVASDPLIWEQHPAHDRYKEEVFREFFRESLESGGALVVIDRQTQEIIGSSRYFGFDSEEREIEIGWTFLARSHWGGKYNGELKRLMLDHAFRFVESVVFLIGPTNVRSQRALEKIGGVMTERREKRNLHGETVIHVVYQIKKPTVTPST
jgi:N-acetyltransferase